MAAQKGRNRNVEIPERGASTIKMEDGTTPRAAVEFGTLTAGETFRLANGSRILMKIHPIYSRGTGYQAVYLHDGEMREMEDSAPVVRLYCTMRVEE